MAASLTLCALGVIKASCRLAQIQLNYLDNLINLTLN